MLVEIHVLFPSPGDIEKMVLEVGDKKLLLEQFGTIFQVTFEERISRKLLKNIRKNHQGDGWIVGYVAEFMPNINNAILNQRYTNAHLLIRTYSVMDITQLWVITRNPDRKIRVASPSSVAIFPPFGNTALKFDRVYIRDLVDSMHSYFNGNYEECIRKAITSVETFIKYHQIEIKKEKGGLDFKKTITTHMDIICPVSQENAVDVIWEAYKVRNDIVHDGKRLDPTKGKNLGKRVTHLVNEVYKNYGTNEELKRYAFYLEMQFLLLEEHVGDIFTLKQIEITKLKKADVVASSVS